LGKNVDFPTWMAQLKHNSLKPDPEYEKKKTKIAMDRLTSDQTVVGSNPAGGAYIWG